MDFLSIFDIIVALEEHPFGLVYAIDLLVTLSRAPPYYKYCTVYTSSAVNTKFVPAWNGSCPRHIVPLSAQRANTRAAGPSSSVCSAYIYSPSTMKNIYLFVYATYLTHWIPELFVERATHSPTAPRTGSVHPTVALPSWKYICICVWYTVHVVSFQPIVEGAAINSYTHSMTRDRAKGIPTVL